MIAVTDTPGLLVVSTLVLVAVHQVAVVVLAAEYRTDVVLALDRRDFRAPTTGYLAPSPWATLG